jgi:hypothetical protein
LLTFAELRAEVERLREAYDDYRLWEPGRAGYAEARRRFDAVMRGA